jgi:hypothetical protein
VFAGMSDHGNSKLALWFHGTCGIDKVRAELLADKVIKECALDNVIAFKEMILHVPDALTKLGVPLALQMILREKLTVCENKQLELLSVKDVSSVVRKLFPHTPEIATEFEQKKINGYVLSQATTWNQLRQWGLQPERNCVTLLGCINNWRLSGVPPDWFTYVRDQPAPNGASKSSLPTQVIARFHQCSSTPC